MIELLISLALAGVVVAGALQLHVAYNGQSARQQQIADVQQSLRVSMQILERAIRSAGSGMVAPKSLALPNPQYTGGVMVCGATKIYGFQFWNGNTFPSAYNTAAIANDPDPDYFKVIAAQADPPVVAKGYDPPSLTATLAGSLALWNPNDLVLFLQSPLNPPAGIPGSCLRTISSPIAGQTVTFAAPGAPLPCNPPADDGCIGAIAPGAEVEVRHFANEIIFRVIPPVVASDSPRLALRQAQINNVDPTLPWMPIADNIEDMQIAMILSDGTVCNSIDDPSICDPSQAMAVRVTLVARSTSRMEGNPPAPIGGFEDEAAATLPNDGFLRRSMTTQINLRN